MTESAVPEAPVESLDEAFARRLCARLPRDVLESFSDDEMRAIIAAFGNRRWRTHALDVRVTVPVFGRHVYFVLLGGRERRSAARRRADRATHPLVSAANVVFATAFFGVVLGCGLVALYFVKSLLGIDFDTGFSLGLYAAVREQLAHLLGL